MRLLKPQENNEVSPEERKKREELSLIEEAITRQNKALNELRDEDKRERERLLKEHEAFISQKLSEKKAIESDIAKILAIKAVALEPLDKRKKELDEREEEIKGRETPLLDKEKQLEARENIILHAAGKSKQDFEDALEMKKEVEEREKKLESEKKNFESYVARQKDLLKREQDRIRKLFETKGRNKK